MFGGVLMFPTGLVFLHVHTLVVLVGLVLLFIRKWFGIPFVCFLSLESSPIGNLQPTDLEPSTEMTYPS